MSKSHVSMETNVCVVCGEEYDTGSILLDRRLKESMEHHTCTGYGMCPEHQKLKDEGYIALIEATNEGGRSRLKLHEANRTGMVVHIKAEAFTRIFNRPVPERGMAYVEPGVVQFLQKVAPQN